MTNDLSSLVLSFATLELIAFNNCSFLSSEEKLNKDVRNSETRPSFKRSPTDNKSIPPSVPAIIQETFGMTLILKCLSQLGSVRK